MVDNEILKRLFNAFSNSAIYKPLEFIVDRNPRVYSSFAIGSCENEEDVDAKVLEWLSREAYKAEHYRNKKRNDEVHEYHLNGINKFLGTSFTPEDMEIIYCKLGNACDDKKTRKFIRSGYNMGVLKNG